MRSALLTVYRVHSSYSSSYRRLLIVVSTTFSLLIFLLFFSTFPFRVIIGAFHGVVHPSLYFLFQNWFPKKEQSTALSMLLLGTSLGLILNVPIAGAIADIQIFDNVGWSLLFYGGSLLHIFWLLFWALFVTDAPELHNMIKDSEIGYIRQNSKNILETVSNLRFVLVFSKHLLP